MSKRYPTRKRRYPREESSSDAMDKMRREGSERCKGDKGDSRKTASTETTSHQAFASEWILRPTKKERMMLSFFRRRCYVFAISFAAFTLPTLSTLLQFTTTSHSKGPPWSSQARTCSLSRIQVSWRLSRRFFAHTSKAVSEE